MLLSAHLCYTRLGGSGQQRLLVGVLMIPLRESPTRLGHSGICKHLHFHHFFPGLIIIGHRHHLIGLAGAAWTAWVLGKCYINTSLQNEARAVSFFGYSHISIIECRHLTFDYSVKQPIGPRNSNIYWFNFWNIYIYEIKDEFSMSHFCFVWSLGSSLIGAICHAILFESWTFNFIWDLENQRKLADMQIELCNTQFELCNAKTILGDLLVVSLAGQQRASRRTDLRVHIQKSSNGAIPFNRVLELVPCSLKLILGSSSWWGVSAYAVYFQNLHINNINSSKKKSSEALYIGWVALTVFCIGSEQQPRQNDSWEDRSRSWDWRNDLKENHNATSWWKKIMHKLKA